jgi:hypothetical protein
MRRGQHIPDGALSSTAVQHNFLCMWCVGMKGANFSSHRQNQSHILVDAMIHDLQFNDNIVALDLRRNVYLWRLIGTCPIR